MSNDGVCLPPSTVVTKKGELKSRYVALNDRKEVVVDFSAENAEEAKSYLNNYYSAIHCTLYVGVQDE